jgi:hypothetical protein
METKLATTNVLLGIMAVASLLEALVVIGFFLGAFLLYRRLLRVLAGIEERQVAPVAISVNAILDDIKDVTSTAKEDIRRARWVVDRVIHLIHRFSG